MRLHAKFLPFVAIPLIVMLGMVALLAWYASQANAIQAKDARSDRAIRTANVLLRNFNEALSEQRGWVNSGKLHYRKAFLEYVARVPQAAAELTELSKDDSEQSGSAVDIERLAKRLTVLMTAIVYMEDVKERNIALSAIVNPVGATTVRALRQRVENVISNNTNDQDKYSAQLAQMWHSLTVGFLILSLVACGVYLAFAASFVRIIAKRLNLLGLRASQAIGGDYPAPDYGRDEISDLDRNLQSMARDIRNTDIARSRYALLADNTHDAIIFVDRDTYRIVEANNAALEMYRYSHDEFMSITLGDIQPITERSEIEDHLAGADRSGMVFESLGLRSDGTTFPMEVSIRSHLAPGNRVVLGIVRDISERRDTNIELSRALEHAVAADKLKSEFVATVSHELRTPLNGIIGMSELLLRTQLDRDQRESAQTMHDSSIALLRIISDILDFSKLEAGQVELETIDFQVRPIVEGVVELVSRSFKRELVSMMTYVSPEVAPMLRGDPGRLRQILLNLVGNAVKFTAVGSVLVSVETDPAFSDGTHLRFLVADTGVGMSPDVRARLFKPFVQGDVATARRFGGTGLGLVIAKAYVELMEGTIDLESTLNVGTRITFTATFASSQEETQRADLTAIGSLRLLIIDGDPASRRVLERYAEDWKITYASVDEGVGALAMLRAAAAADCAFDCAIVDYQLPNLSGLEVAAEIKNDPAIAGTRLMMLTANDDAGRADAARASGFSAYLSKPIVQSHVYDQLVAMMSKEAPPPVQTPSEDAALGESHLHLRVLLAEDNAVNRRVAGRQLSLLGCEVVMVENGEEAVRILEDQQFDVVLMDCNMPVMDGLTATRRIRAREAETVRRTVPIVAMTANASEDDRGRCSSAGMTDYVSKPVLVDSLRAALLRVTGVVAKA